jgi:hypothetical protein
MYSIIEGRDFALKGGRPGFRTSDGKWIPIDTEKFDKGELDKLTADYVRRRGSAQIEKDKAAHKAEKERQDAARSKSSTPAPTPAPASTKPAPSPTPAPQAPKPASAPPKTSSPPASTAVKSQGSDVYRQQIKKGDIKGAEKTGMDIWRAKYANTLAKNVTPSGTQKGTGQSVMAKQAAELRALRPAPQAPGNEKPGYSGPPTPTAPQAQSKLAGGSYSSGATKLMTQRTKNVLRVKESYDSFDLVLEYLLSTGHVDTLNEALYVMMEMNSEMIHNIIENVEKGPILPGEKGKRVYPKGQEPKATGAKLPPV